MKKVNENWHNFFIRYWNYKLHSSLETLLQGLCDTKLKIGYENVLHRYKALYDDLGFLSLYMEK